MIFKYLRLAKNGRYLYKINDIFYIEFFKGKSAVCHERLNQVELLSLIQF